MANNKIKKEGSSAGFASGFTLIELLVSIALFSVAVSIAAGGFVHALKTQRQVAALVAVNSNASLFLEELARAVRVSGGFCGGDDGTSNCGNTLNFTNVNFPDYVHYRLNPGGYVERATGRSPSDSDYERVTPEAVNVEYFTADVNYISFFSDHPTRVTIAMGVKPRIAGVDQSVLRLQTTVSVR